MKLQVQTQLDNRYRITAFLSQGGFGYTYLAEDLFGKKVCIKELYINNRSTRGPGQEVITEDTSDFSFEHFSTRFWEEAKQLAAFDHPNIVKVKDFFRSNGSTYLVMEYIEGETLQAKKLNGGLNDEQSIFAVMTQVIAAVETVHNAGMLHRDIKPENVLIAHDNRVVLIDFGSARDYEEAKTLTQSTILTPGYAPIEQYSNRAKRGAFTDIYALGATLYFLLTGQKPLAATDRYREQLPSPQQLNPAISTQLSSAVMMAMAMEPEDRFQTVADLKAALLLSGKKVEKPVVTETRTLNEVLTPPKTAQIETHNEITEKPVKKSNVLLFALVGFFVLILFSFLVWGSGEKTEQSFCDCYENLAESIKGEKNDSLKIVSYDNNKSSCNTLGFGDCQVQIDLEKTIVAAREREFNRLENYVESLVPILTVRREKLLKILREYNIYDGEGVDQLERRFADESQRDELYGHIVDADLYTKSRAEFDDQYFYDIIFFKKNGIDPSTRKENLKKNQKSSSVSNLKQALRDFITTANSGKYTTEDELMSKFPELQGYDIQVLRDFVTTANSGKYSDEETLFSKFPEFGITK